MECRKQVADKAAEIAQKAYKEWTL